MAIGAVKYAKVKAISVPEELSISGYNDSIMAISSEPELTSVDSKLNVLCKTTVDHMISLLEKQEEIEKNVVVPCEIVKRCTTDFLGPLGTEFSGFFCRKKPENSVPNGLFGLLIGNLSILHQYKSSIEACCLFIVVGDVKHGQI